MPLRDQTGPNGQGKLTGRGLGPCGEGSANVCPRGRAQGDRSIGIRGRLAGRRQQRLQD
ncbi:MAG: DUF5320 domain-containing protein [Candidatus Falkowbacteria bacterium]